MNTLNTQHSAFSLVSALVLAGTIGGRQAIEKTTCPEGVSEADFQKLQKLVLDHPEVFKQAGE